MTILFSVFILPKIFGFMLQFDHEITLSFIAVDAHKKNML